MRFQIREHKELVKVLKEEGFAENEVLFVKKRGRLHVQLPDRTGAFYFFRKRTMELDQHGQFKPVVEYTVNDGKRTMDWNAVLDRFAQWLRREV